MRLVKLRFRLCKLGLTLEEVGTRWAVNDGRSAKTRTYIEFASIDEVETWLKTGRRIMTLEERYRSGEFANPVKYPYAGNKERDLWAQEIAAYHAGQNAAVAKFRAAVEEKHEMVGHPKADMLWQKSWEHGHSSGLMDILYWYEDLIELVK